MVWRKNVEQSSSAAVVKDKNVRAALETCLDAHDQWVTDDNQCDPSFSEPFYQAESALRKRVATLGVTDHEQYLEVTQQLLNHLPAKQQTVELRKLFGTKDNQL